MFYKKGVLKFCQNSQETPVPGSQTCNIIKKETLAQVFCWPPMDASKECKLMLAFLASDKNQGNYYYNFAEHYSKNSF